MPEVKFGIEWVSNKEIQDAIGVQTPSAAYRWLEKRNLLGARKKIGRAYMVPLEKIKAALLR